MLRISLLAVVLCGTAVMRSPAQVLLGACPESTLIYARAEGGLDEFRKLAGDQALWNMPMNLDDKVLKQMDRGLEMMGKQLGVPTGSASAWVRSIKGWELAIFSIDADVGFFEMDFALAIRTPMAEQIYDLVSGALLKRAFAEKTGDGEIEIPLDDFGLNITRRNDYLLMCGNASRLRTLARDLGGVKPGNLGQSEIYRKAVGQEKTRFVSYLSVDALIDLGVDIGALRGPGRGRGRGRGGVRGGPTPEGIRNILDQFGVTKIRGLCYAETDRNSVLRVQANGKVIPFDMMTTRGAPTLLGVFPDDTVYAFAWPGRLEDLWKIYRDQIVLNPELPFAPFLQEGIRTFQERSGISVDEIAKLCDEGMSFGIVPLPDGRIREGSQVLVARTSQPDRVGEIAGSLVEQLGDAQEGSEPNTFLEAGALWFFPRGRDRGPNRNLCVVVTGNSMVIGGEAGVRATLASMKGERPSLKSKGVMRGLRSGSTAYWHLNYATMLSQEKDFSAGASALRSGAGLTGTLDVTPKSLEMRTLRPLSEAFSVIAVSAATQEAMSKQRSESMANLKQVQEAYLAYLGKNNKHPKTLSQLGFSGENALVCPLDKQSPTAKASYMLVPGPPAGEDERAGRWEIRAYATNTSYGRLVLGRDGRVRPWPEGRFQAALRALKNR